jgi:hypothetical protein
LLLGPLHHLAEKRLTARLLKKSLADALDAKRPFDARE